LRERGPGELRSPAVRHADLDLSGGLELPAPEAVVTGHNVSSPKVAFSGPALPLLLPVHAVALAHARRGLHVADLPARLPADLHRAAARAVLPERDLVHRDLHGCSPKKGSYKTFTRSQAARR